LADITLTFIESRHPKKFLRYLVEVRGYAVEETLLGIYQVSGDYIPIQVIESKRLSEKENLWLKSLTNDLELHNMSVILKAGQKHRHKEEIDAYLDLIMRANLKTFLEVQKMGYPTMEEVLTEAGYLPEWLERGRALGIEQGIKQGIEQGIVQGIEQGTEHGKEIIARNLLRMGMPISEIAKATELPIEKIMQMNNE
jgi:predicted transposase/invertase (TIGR01784 family)